MNVGRVPLSRVKLIITIAIMVFFLSTLATVCFLGLIGTGQFVDGTGTGPKVTDKVGFVKKYLYDFFSELDAGWD